jgi:hypothetical protein
MTVPLDIETSARRTGAHRWVELRLFEILGSWSVGPGHPAARRLFGGHSRHHAGRAGLWAGCLPTLPHLDPDAATAPPSPALAVFFDDLAGLAAGDDAVDRLVGVYRVVVPRLGTAYDRRRRALTEVADGPVLRALRLVRPDLGRDGAAGEALLQSLLVPGDGARRAAERQGWLEGRLIDAGGIP